MKLGEQFDDLEIQVRCSQKTPEVENNKMKTIETILKIYTFFSSKKERVIFSDQEVVASLFD
jgi:hypothetical protein